MKKCTALFACVLQATSLVAQTRITVPANREKILPSEVFSATSAGSVTFSPGNNFRKLIQSSRSFRKVNEQTYAVCKSEDSLNDVQAMAWLDVDTINGNGMLSLKQAFWSLQWLSSQDTAAFVTEGAFYVFFIKKGKTLRHLFIRNTGNTWYVGYGRVTTPWVWPPGTVFLVPN